MKANVLFLCTGNSCRSQMAEAFLRAFAGERFTVFSAGLAPRVINPWTYRVMAELGYDLAGQRSKHVNEYQGVVDFDYVITVCDDADKNCPAFLGRARHRMHWASKTGKICGKRRGNAGQIPRGARRDCGADQSLAGC